MENIYFIGPTDIEGIKLATVDMLERFVTETSIFCYDTETTGLDPHSDEIIMVQIGDKKTQFVIDVRSVDISHIIQLLPSKKLIGANLSFDYKFTLSKYGVRLQNLQDIRIREMVLECGRQKFGFSLQLLAKKYCDVSLEKDTRNEFAFLNGKMFNERQILYGGRDVIYPQIIYEKQQKRILEDNLGKTIHLEQEFVRVIAEMEYNGMYVDQEKWKELFIKNQEEYLKAKEELDNYLIDNNITKFLGPLDLFTGKPSVPINWSSNAQVVPVFKHFGIPTEVLDKDKTNEVKDRYGLDIEIFKDSVGKVEVSKYEKEFPFVALYLKYKKYEKAVTTYGEKWLQENINLRTQRVHSSFYQILNTGRISSSRPNVQQIPSFKSPGKLSCEAHRTCFIAPPGRKLIVRDFSACELRILADYSSEQSMQDEFKHGTGDLHSLTASKVYSEIEGKHVPVSSNVNKHLRHLGKTLNFALTRFFIMTPKEFAKKENISYYKALKHFKKNGLQLEGQGGKNRSVNYNPFNNSEISEYWLGYISADGNISSNSNSLTIISKDIEHLLKFKDFCPESNVYYNDNKVIIGLTNKLIKDFCIKKGIVPNKSKIFEYKGDLTNHFIRGIFDGDGSISNNRPKITSGSILFIQQLEKLFDSLGFKYSTRFKDKNKTCLDIEILYESRLDFYNWMYKNANIFMERKYEKYSAYIERSISANGVNSKKAEMPTLSEVSQGCEKRATTNNIPLEQ